jgi:acyl-CoA synthetase (AMP-forming)/AMP-acid ligase II
VQSGYGMTETCSHQYTMPFDNRTRITESCGRACRGYEIRIWSPDDPDSEMPVGQIGQVGGRGASLMLVYFDDQIATESSLNAAGWFLTGDLGFLDADGYLHLTGRMKELIIRGGHNINPAPIEKLVLQFDEIAHAAVVGMPDLRLGERICLAVHFHQGKRVSKERICQHLRQAGVSRYEMPEFLAEMDDVPLMPNGKLRRREIEQAVRAGAVPVQAIAGEAAPAPGGTVSPPAS